jgi:hypothetical protein
MLVRVNAGDADSMPDDVFMLVDGGPGLAHVHDDGLRRARAVRGGEGAALARLFGRGARWWTNVPSWTFTPARAWKPVTWHTMDAVVVGVGDGVIVTIVAFDDD